MLSRETRLTWVTHCPKGPQFINCIWTINNSSERCPNPRDFDPSRHRAEDTLQEGFGINPDTTKRPHITFGVGRRVCPGYNVAIRTLFMEMSRILDAMVDALVTGPQPFECEIKPRSAEHEKVIRDGWAKAERELDSEGHYADEFFSRFDRLWADEGDKE
ncbi:hypothetical protein RBB50_005729 [Rhinocladiella similis]